MFRPRLPAGTNWEARASEAAFELARRLVALGHQITERPALLGAGKRIESATEFPTVGDPDKPG